MALTQQQIDVVMGVIKRLLDGDSLTPQDREALLAIDTIPISSDGRERVHVHDAIVRWEASLDADRADRAVEFLERLEGNPIFRKFVRNRTTH